jgi:hypothetical protein
VSRPRPIRRAENNFIVITLDSCRFDTFMQAAPKTILKLGAGERRWSYASWTGPSHYNLLTGLLPHTSPPNVYASEYYKEDFYNYNKRLGAKDVEFAKMVPGCGCRDSCATRSDIETHARVQLAGAEPEDGREPRLRQLPVDGQAQRHALDAADDEVLGLAAVVLFAQRRRDALSRTRSPDEDSSMWPRISGVNGVSRRSTARSTSRAA